VMGAVPSGWANVQPQTLLDKAFHFFYEIWQLMDAKKPGRRSSDQERLWGGDRPGLRSDYLDESATREDRR